MSFKKKSGNVDTGLLIVTSFLILIICISTAERKKLPRIDNMLNSLGFVQKTQQKTNLQPRKQKPSKGYCLKTTA